MYIVKNIPPMGSPDEQHNVITEYEQLCIDNMFITSHFTENLVDVFWIEFQIRYKPRESFLPYRPFVRAGDH